MLHSNWKLKENSRNCFLRLNLERIQIKFAEKLEIVFGIGGEGEREQKMHDESFLFAV